MAVVGEESNQEEARPRGELFGQLVGLIGIAILMFGLGFLAGSRWEEQKRGEKEKVVVGKLLPPQVEVLQEEIKPGETKEEEGQFWNILLGKETSLFPSSTISKLKQEEKATKERTKLQENQKERPPTGGSPSPKVQEKPQLPPSHGSAPSQGPRYCLQVMSLQSPQKAESVARELSSKGYTGVRVKAVEVPGRGTWYRVWIGGFEKKEEAEALAKRIRERERLDARVVVETN